MSFSYAFGDLIVQKRLNFFERWFVAEQIDVGARHQRAPIGLR